MLRMLKHENIVDLKEAFKRFIFYRNNKFIFSKIKIYNFSEKTEFI